jgi:hypothetical protein
MRVSIRVTFIIASIAAGLLCGNLIAAAQTYSPNYPYGLQANPVYGRGFGTEYHPYGISHACECLRIVASRACPDAYLLAIFTGDDAIAVELDLVQPARPGGWPVSVSGLARDDEAGRLEK